MTPEPSVVVFVATYDLATELMNVLKSDDDLYYCHHFWSPWLSMSTRNRDGGRGPDNQPLFRRAVQWRYWSSGRGPHPNQADRIAIDSLILEYMLPTILEDVYYYFDKTIEASVLSHLETL